MTGGLLQIVASGAQDVYLTGNPQITFFKVLVPVRYRYRYQVHIRFSFKNMLSVLCANLLSKLMK